MDVQVGTAAPYSLDEAKQAIAGYCFGQSPVEWGAPPSAVVGQRPAATTRYRYAYRCYDCVPRSMGPGLDLSDVLAAEGLNARMGAGPMLHVQALLPELSSVVASIPPGLRFWDLERSEVSSPPTHGDPAYGLWRAWFLLRLVPGIHMARTHKILHRVRPDVFPLLDNLTMGHLRAMESWSHIHDDLTQQVQAFTHLEDWFDGLLRPGDVPLLRLRLHDILLWLDAAGGRDQASSLGDEVLAERG